MIDAEEHLYLAIHAHEKGDAQASLQHLHEVLKIEPQNARATYLLATQHVQLGMLDRGLEGLKRAIALDPTREVAKLQLGMLLLRMDRIAEAEPQLSALIGSDDAALANYAQAMLMLGHGDSAKAREMMLAGLENRQRYPALTRLMKSIVEELSAPPPPAEPQRPQENTISLGAYRTTSR